LAGRYFSKDPRAWTFTPDLSRPAYDQNLHKSINARLTWEVDQKNKITFAAEYQNICLCYATFGVYATMPWLNHAIAWSADNPSTVLKALLSVAEEVLPTPQ
jgi:hypothetical protein